MWGYMVEFTVGKVYEITYHFITNRWQIESMSEDKVRAILTLMPMGGIQLDGKRLVVHGNVEVVDMALQELL